MGVKLWLQSQYGREEALPAYWKAELRKNMGPCIDGPDYRRYYCAGSPGEPGLTQELGPSASGGPPLGFWF